MIDFYGGEGDGEMREAIEALAKEGGLTVKFHGRVTKVILPCKCWPNTDDDGDGCSDGDGDGDAMTMTMAMKI